jgi:hypothetical protein
MNANEENIYAVLHQFRNWNREWDKVIKSNAKSVDDFVIELAKTWEVNKKLHMNNQDFQWDDNKVKEFWMGNTIHNSDDSLNAAIEKFKASKQKPLEYEIISIYIDQTPMFPIKPISPVNGKIRLLIGTKEYSETIEDCFNINECVKIFSVKRTSDGEVFSIGDETNYGSIDKFTIQEKVLYAIIKLQNNMGFTLDELRKAQPKKQPLLTTQDGIEIFEGDTLFTVYGNDFKLAKTSDFKEGKKIIVGFPKYFSTKEAAEEYVLMNKPCLSVAEVYDISAKYGLPAVAIEQEITELAKSKNK